MSAEEDPGAEFLKAMARLGLAPKGSIRADGRLHRFDVDGDRPGSRNGFYTLHLDGRAAGAFGCWKRGIKETWKANGSSLTDTERAGLMNKIEADRAHREREETREQEEAAAIAGRLWAGYGPAASDHPYLVRKQVQPHGAKVDDQGNLVLTVSDTDGAIWSLQTIDATGNKLFMQRGRKRGCMFIIGDLSDRVVIVEGFATGASIHEATGIPVAVAFDTSGLEPVARAIRAKQPNVQIVIAADDDRETKRPVVNPGMYFASRVSKAIGARVAVPVFQDPDGRKDFNDLAVAEGSQAVAAIILKLFLEPGSGIRANEGEVDWKARLEAGIAELNRTFFVAAMGGRATVASLAQDDALGRERLVFSREQDVRLLFGHRHYIIGHTRAGNEIWKGIGEAWLADARRRTYRQIALIFDGPCPRDVFNLWRGFGVVPKPGRWGTIEAHLKEVISAGAEANYQWLLGWLAYCVQNPGRQAEVAVVLRGLKGTGKGMLAQIMMRIFHNHSLHISNSRHLVGNFNGHLVDALFLFLDEAFWGGDKQGEGTLKALITERAVMIEPKGVDPFQMPNRLKIIMASNNDWVVPASTDERRYFVLDVSDRRIGDKGYFNALAAAIEGDELAAFVDALLAMDLSGFDHRNPPHTDGLNRQKLISATSLEKFWMDCLTAGEIVGTDVSGWPDDVVVKVLHAAYQDHALAHGDRHPMIDARMAEELQKLMPGQMLARYRPRRSDLSGHEDRSPCYRLPHLDEARAAFLAAMNIKPTTDYWPIVEEEDE